MEGKKCVGPRLSAFRKICIFDPNLPGERYVLMVQAFLPQLPVRPASHPFGLQGKL